MRLFVLLVLLTAGNLSLAAEPEEVLEQYFGVLTGRDYADLPKIMASTSMSDLKALIDKVIRYQADHGNYGLQRRIFGEQVSLERVDKTPPEYYLNRLAGEILSAANAQHFYVDDRAILGRVDEDQTTVHIVARLTMHQDDEENTDVLLYTLVKEGDDWKLTFPPTFKQLLSILEASYKQQRDRSP